MKLLFLAHRIPYPPNKGDKIRSFNQLRALAARGHDVHLLAFADDQSDLGRQFDLLRYCASVQIVPLIVRRARLRAYLNIFTGSPLSLGYFASGKMKSLVRRAFAEHNFDAIFVYSSPMAQYVPEEFASRTIVDLVDVDSEKWRDYSLSASPPQSWGYEMEWKRLRKYEYRIVRRYLHTLLTTHREASLLDELDEFTRRARLRVITNGVDLDYYNPQFERKDVSSTRLVFTGAMDYYANIEGVRWFVEEVFPLILESEPKCEFFIVGSNPTEEVKRLGRRKGVTVTGYVNDIRPYLAGAAACVVPLRIARGVQNKVLEAMAAGKSIIATPEAVAGLRVEDGEQMIIAREPAEFAQSTLRVMRDEALRERLGFQARRFAEIGHDWEPLMQMLVELAESAARSSVDSGANNGLVARKRF